MKVTLNWLKQYVNFRLVAGRTAERLTMLGIEVEAARRLAESSMGCRGASRHADKHPNADKPRSAASMRPGGAPDRFAGPVRA